MRNSRKNILESLEVISDELKKADSCRNSRGTPAEMPEELLERFLKIPGGISEELQEKFRRIPKKLLLGKFPLLEEFQNISSRNS